MKNKFKLNPLKVMVDPRGFMKIRQAKSKIAVLLLAWIVGIVLVFAKSYALGLGNQFSPLVIIVTAVILGIPIGYFVFYITAFFLYLTGKIFRGIGSFSDLLYAFVWSRVPELFQLIAWIGIIALYKYRAFTPFYIFGQNISILAYLLLIAQVVFTVWKSIILFHTVGEVQGYSAWVAIWNVLLTFAILFCIDYLFNLIFISNFKLKAVATIISFL